MSQPNPSANRPVIDTTTRIDRTTLGLPPHPQALLDEKGRYTTNGKVWRICPRLMQLDKRHGMRNDQWPNAWRNPLHTDFLEDPEGHDSNLFMYGIGSNPENADEWPKCQACGRPLIATDGDPI